LRGKKKGITSAGGGRQTPSRGRKGGDWLNEEDEEEKKREKETPLSRNAKGKGESCILAQRGKALEVFPGEGRGRVSKLGNQIKEGGT